LATAFNVIGPLALLLPGTTVALFTGYVFRRDTGWARALALVLALLNVLPYLLSRWLAPALGFEATLSLETGTLFYWLTTAFRCAGYAWSCAEALLYYHGAQRRLALGLTTPLVSNRFLLWAIWSGSAMGFIALKITSQHFWGPGPGTPAPFLWSMLILACCCASAIWLTFKPPAFYRRWISMSAPIAA
jgi:hypothetical protein